MYHMMLRQRNIGAVLDAEDEDDEDVHVFMDKYDLQKRYVTFWLYINMIFIFHTGLSIVRKVISSAMFRRVNSSPSHRPRKATDL
jgi:hypothetical protein